MFSEQTILQLPFTTYNKLAADKLLKTVEYIVAKEEIAPKIVCFRCIKMCLQVGRG